MGCLCLIALAFTVFVSAGSGAGLGPRNQYDELFVYEQKIYATHQLLEEECPELVRMKRETYNDRSIPFHLEVSKVVYSQLIEALINCREAKKQTETATTTAQPMAKDCQELYERGERTVGVHQIQPLNYTLGPFNVSCDFFDGHGWTVMQKRFDGSVDFDKYWDEYKNGFGVLQGEYWLGNDKIHALTQTNQKLNIYVKAADGSSRSGNWQTFYTADESDKYRLTVNEDGYSGDLPQGKLTYHNGMDFSTKDQDNDRYDAECANIYKGGWWHNQCHMVHLNGLYNNFNEWRDFAPNLVTTTMRVTRN